MSSNRVLLGKNSSNEYVLQISRPGVDVLTANKGDLIFDSDNPHWGQFFQAGQVQVEGGETETVSFSVPSDMLPLILVEGGAAATYDTEENEWVYEEPTTISNELGRSIFSGTTDADRFVDIDICDEEITITNTASYTIFIEYIIVVIDVGDL